MKSIFASEASPGAWTHPAHTTLLLLMVYNDHSNKSTLAIPPLPKTYIRTYDFGLIMRPITISLDSVTWELAKKKINFSSWVRDKLRSERNHMAEKANDDYIVKEIRENRMNRIENIMPISTSELCYHLERRSDAEITALVSILQGSLPPQ